MKYSILFVPTNILNETAFVSTDIFSLISETENPSFFQLTHFVTLIEEEKKEDLGDFLSLEKAQVAYLNYLVDNKEKLQLIYENNIELIKFLTNESFDEFYTKTFQTISFIITQLKKTKKRLRDLQKASIDYFGEDRIDLVNNQLYIYFPEITVSNSNGKNHKYYDLYLRIYINDSSGFTNSLEGYRTTYSKQEFNSFYMFSHLARRYNYQWSSACLGYNTSLGEFFKSNPTITYSNSLILFSLLEQYLSWESLEGGPYVQFSSIGMPLNKVELKNKTSQYHFFMKDINKNFLKLSTESIESKELEEDVALKYCNQSVLYFSYDHYIDPYTIEIPKDNSITYYGENTFTFQNTIKGIIKIDSSLDKDLKELVKNGNIKPHPLFLSFLQSSLNLDLNLFLKNNLTKYLIKNEPNKKEQLEISTA